MPTSEENKAIVDRWLTNFWGKSYNPAIVDELTERNVFFGHSLYTPQIALHRSRRLWRSFGGASRLQR